jgi:nicotinamide-nucleotide adenylyltransferase
MRKGIFIGRFQPFHIGHLDVVEEMENANDLEELLIGIGSAQYSNTYYNPFTAEEREQMIRKGLHIKKPYHIINIDDLNDYPRWVPYVESLCPEFHVVYAGNTIVKKLFEERGYETREMNNIHKISGTEVRKMMINGGTWQLYVPDGTKDVILQIGGVERLRKIVGLGG